MDNLLLTDDNRNKFYELLSDKSLEKFEVGRTPNHIIYYGRSWSHIQGNIWGDAVKIFSRRTQKLLFTYVSDHKDIRDYDKMIGFMLKVFSHFNLSKLKLKTKFNLNMSDKYKQIYATQDYDGH